MSDSPEMDGRAADKASVARIPRDAIVGAAILAFCLTAWLVTLGFKEAPAVIAQNVQPATFPRMVLLVMVILTTIIIVLSFRRPEKPNKPLKAMLWPSAAIMPAFVIAFDLLGVLPAMVLLSFFLPLLWGERRLTLIIPYSIIFPTAIYLLFAVILKVRFAPSPLVFW